MNHRTDNIGESAKRIHFIQHELRRQTLQLACANGERLATKTANLVLAVRESRWMRATGECLGLLRLIRVQAEIDQLLERIGRSDGGRRHGRRD